MAKKQPGNKAVDKKPKSISTSAIFKKAKVLPAPRAQPVVWTMLQDSNFLKKSKNKRTPEHPLATAFSGQICAPAHLRYQLITYISESISHSREHIKQQATSSLASIGHDLSSRVINVSKHFEEQLQATSESGNKLLIPLQDEELKFQTHDGRSAGTVVLGDRMTQFRKVVAAEEKILESLRREWMDVQKEIMAIAGEMLGAKGLEELMDGGLLEGMMTMEQEKRAEEVEGLKKRFLEEVGRLSAEAVEGVREGEKVRHCCCVPCPGEFTDGLLVGDEDP